ncbi:hypothetical protein [Nostoc sp.]|uniref:hypothetical protein n=1 Tax=Nostoc sp. TaxID=1180 RepID=UPI002FFCFF4A
MVLFKNHFPDVIIWRIASRRLSLVKVLGIFIEDKQRIGLVVYAAIASSGIKILVIYF